MIWVLNPKRSKYILNMRKVINKGMRWYLAQRYKHIHAFSQNPHPIQKKWFDYLITSAQFTEWGKKFDYKNIKTPTDFAERVPIQDYESLKPFIERMMLGEKDVLWHGETRWFSKSSGTTSAKSKFIPVSNQNIKQCHIKGTWDTMSIIYNQIPDAKQFQHKTLLMGGNIEAVPNNSRAMFGDVSAIMIKHMPQIARPFFTPDFDTALHPDFEEKLDIMTRKLVEEKDMVMIGGVPTWLIVLFRKMLDYTGKQNMLEIWPNLQVYTHGGVSFEPYRQQFRDFFPSDKVNYFEIYNASEGFFAMQYDKTDKDMLLLMDSGVYYEFLPQSEWYKKNKKAIPLKEVVKGENYAMVISTSSGLWRYITGDTIIFTSTYPHKIKITGRINQFVNAFGEEVIVENTEDALAMTCDAMNASIKDYTVAPIYMKEGNKGGHHWLIEWERPPADVKLFARILDQEVQNVNSDYTAKRFNDLALKELKITSLPPGTFHRWLRKKGKYNNQSKVPRLANHTEYLDDILNLIN